MLKTKQLPRSTEPDAFGHGLAPAACPRCGSAQIRLTKRDYGTYEVFSARCQVCRSVFDDSGKIYPAYLTTSGPWFSSSAQLFRRWTTDLVPVSPQKKLAQVVSDWADLANRIRRHWAMEPFVPALYKPVLTPSSQTKPKENSTMTNPADANPTQTPAKTDTAKPDAAKTKPSRIWYPTQREMVASHVMASILEGARGPAVVPEQTLKIAAETSVAAADALIKALETPADLV